jgi:hypothetical protein
MIVAIFVAALSLPGDLSEKTIYTVATKPVRRSSVILGKTLGLAALSALILALMGGTSLLVIHYTDARVRHQTKEPSALFARWSLAPEEQYIVGDGLVRRDGRTLVTGKAHSAFVWMFPHPLLLVRPGEPMQVSLRAQFGRQPGFTGPVLPLFAEFKRGEKMGMSLPMDVRPEHIWEGGIPISRADLDPTGRAGVFEVTIGPRTPFEFQADLDDLVMVVNGTPVRAEKMAPRADGLSPKRTITWLSRSAMHQVVWVFRRAKGLNLPAKEIEGFAGFQVSAASIGGRHIDLRFTCGDPADPAHFHQQTVVASRDRLTRFTFPVRCIQPDGGLRIAVERLEKETFLGIPDHINFGIYAQRGNFDLNFVKALLVIFFQLTLLSAFAVAGSTFLSAPVSVLFAFFMFFCGNLVDFMRNAATVLAWGAPPHTHGAPSTVVTLWEKGIAVFSKVVEVTMPKLANILPDLQQFDVAGSVISGDAIPLRMVLNALAYLGAFGIFAVWVGQIVFWRKEIE